MMAGLFLIFTLAILAIILRKRQLAVSIVVIGIILTLSMFWFHATDILQINW